MRRGGVFVRLAMALATVLAASCMVAPTRAWAATSKVAAKAPASSHRLWLEDTAGFEALYVDGKAFDPAHTFELANGETIDVTLKMLPGYMLTRLSINAGAGTGCRLRLTPAANDQAGFYTITMGNDDVSLKPVVKYFCQTVTFSPGGGIDHYEVDGKPVSSLHLATTETVRIVAVPMVGREVTGWSIVSQNPRGGTVENDDTVGVFTMGGSNVILQAQTGEAHLQVTLVAGKGIDHFELGGTRVTSVKVARGMPANITAVRAGGYVSTIWSLNGDAMGTTVERLPTTDGNRDTGRIIMGTGDVSITASAVPGPTHVATLYPPEGIETLFVDGDPYAPDQPISLPEGAVVHLKLKMLPGYMLTRLYLRNAAGGSTLRVASGDAGGYTFTMGTRDVEIAAIAKYFSQSLTLVRGTGIDHYEVNGARTIYLRMGATATVDVVAIPKAGYEVSKWSIVTSNSRGAKVQGDGAKVTFTMGNSNVAIQATAKRPTYTLTVKQVAGATATATKTTLYASGTTLLRATPKPGYKVTGWKIISGTKTGAKLSSTKLAVVTFTMGAGNVTVRPVVAKK